LFLGFDIVAASYLAIAVSFSSTIIIIKLLSEKNALKSLYGKISIGFLLVQDLVAILVLILLSSLGSKGIGGFDFLFIVVKSGVLLVGIFFLSKKIIPFYYEKYVASSNELIFIVSIAWALGIATLVAGPFGLTLEVGGFLAGLSLSNLPEHLEIASKTRSLRDFFLVLFFLNLGASMAISDIRPIILPAILYSFLVLIGNPIIVMLIMGILRFRKRTSFLASVNVAQISEFSLIVVAMGESLGHIDKSFVSLSVMIAMITMTASTYLILGAEKVYLRLKGALSIFERKDSRDLVVIEEADYSNHVVLVGCLRTGPRLLPFFKKRGIPYVVVDFNPVVYKKLAAEGHPVIFGDISDPEILNAARIDKARLVVSTIDSLNDNRVLLEYIRSLPRRPLTLFTSDTKTNALKLYQDGADYVVVPEVVAGDHIRNLLRIYGTTNGRLKRAGKMHFNRLIFA